MIDWIYYTLLVYLLPVIIPSLRRLYFGDLTYMRTPYTSSIPTGFGFFVACTCTGVVLSLVRSYQIGLISTTHINFELFMTAGESELTYGLPIEMIIAVITMIHIFVLLVSVEAIMKTKH